jgi:hypothetical protein
MRDINKHDRMLIDECGLLSGVTIIGMGGALAWKSNREKKVSRESSCESEIHQQDHINHEEEISKAGSKRFSIISGRICISPAGNYATTQISTTVRHGGLRIETQSLNPPL